MGRINIGVGELFIDGVKIADVESGYIETIDPVVVSEDVRWGMGYDYHEKYYFCPKCRKLLAYHNGVKMIYGNTSQKFCSECGYKLVFPEEDQN